MKNQLQGRLVKEYKALIPFIPLPKFLPRLVVSKSIQEGEFKLKSALVLLISAIVSTLYLLFVAKHLQMSFIVIHTSLSVLFVLFMFLTMFMDPGYIKRTEKEARALLASKGLEYDEDLIHCFKCFSLKSELPHHCEVCKICVREHDHHCDVFGNCVSSETESMVLATTILGGLAAFSASVGLLFLILS